MVNHVAPSSLLIWKVWFVTFGQNIAMVDIIMTSVAYSNALPSKQIATASGRSPSFSPTYMLQSTPRGWIDPSIIRIR